MGSIRIKTAVPGPRSRQLLQRGERWVSPGFTPHVPAVIAAARGALVTDVDGNVFIDLAGGLGCLNVGHCAPEVVTAVKQQVEQFLHTDYSVMPYAVLIDLAERLCEAMPGPGPKKAGFFNAGAEAVENACKIARAYTGRPALIAFHGAFHGRTLLALTLTSKAKPYKQGFGPFAAGVYKVPYANCYRCPIGAAYPQCGVACAELVQQAIALQAGPEDTAAVIIEPVQGEGGFVVPPPEYIPRIAEICRSMGVLLILDEVQTGFGRTGALFAAQRMGVAPDLITVGKSIAAGLPLSGVVGRAAVMDATDEGRIGGTYVGNPVACRAALEVLDILEKENLFDRAEALGDRVEQRLRSLAERTHLIGDVRRLGAMVGVELVRDKTSKEPAPEETGRILARAMQDGVIVVKCGTYGNVLRFLMPLVITDQQLDEALAVLEKAVLAETPS